MVDFSQVHSRRYFSEFPWHFYYLLFIFCHIDDDDNLLNLSVYLLLIIISWLGLWFEAKIIPNIIDVCNRKYILKKKHNKAYRNRYLIITFIKS